MEVSSRIVTSTPLPGVSLAAATYPARVFGSCSHRMGRGLIGSLSCLTRSGSSVRWNSRQLLVKSSLCSTYFSGGYTMAVNSR